MSDWWEPLTAADSPARPTAVMERGKWRAEISGITDGTIIRVWQSDHLHDRLANAKAEAETVFRGERQ